MGRLKVRLELSGAARAGAIEGAEHAGVLDRRSQPGRHPLYRIGLGDDLIDVIAIDALKRAYLDTTKPNNAWWRWIRSGQRVPP